MVRGVTFDRYFVKPVSVDRLTSELARDLRQRRPRQATPSELDAEDV